MFLKDSLRNSDILTTASTPQAEYKWLRDHCSEYGFIMRYRKDAQSITWIFVRAPWHYRYLGVDHAKACTALGVTYEEYHALLEKLRDEAKTDAGA